jgi:hypothetical protein
MEVELCGVGTPKARLLSLAARAIEKRYYVQSDSDDARVIRTYVDRDLNL